MKTVTRDFSDWNIPVRRSSSKKSHADLHAKILARCLDVFLPSAQIEAKLSSQGALLEGAFSSLTPRTSALLQQSWGTKLLEEAFTLSQEPDTQTFLAGMLLLANRLEDADSPAAATVYAELISEINSFEAQVSDATLLSELRERAQGRLAVLQGNGAFIPQLMHFVGEAGKEMFRPSPLIAMGAASVAFRVTRVGALGFLAEKSPWLGSWEMRALASSAAFATETAVFTGAAKASGALLGEAQDWSWSGTVKEWKGTAAMLAGMRLGGGLTRAATASFHPSFSKWALPQFAMFNGILLGDWLHGEELNFAKAFATLGHFNMAGNLLQRGTGPGFRSWELKADALAEMAASSLPKFSPFGQALPAVAGDVPLSPLLSVELPEAARKSSPMMTTGGGDTSFADVQVRQLKAKYASIFPHSETATDIIDIATKTRAPFFAFHDRLLEAYAGRKNIGTLQQAYTAFAVKHLFDFNPLHSSMGTFKAAQLQLLLERILGMDVKEDRLMAIHAVFNVMERAKTPSYMEREGGIQHIEALGVDSRDLATLVHRYTDGDFKLPFPLERTDPFFARYSATALQAWEGYKPRDQENLLSFIKHESQEQPGTAESMIGLMAQARRAGTYPAADIDAALAAADRSLVGRLILRRLMNIVKEQDIPEKLKDLTRPVNEPSVPLIEQYRLWLADGLSPLEIAERLRGSAYLGFSTDPRLALKAAAMLSDVLLYHSDAKFRQKSWAEFEQKLDAFLLGYKGFKQPELLELLKAGGKTPESEAIEDCLKKKYFKIKFVSPEVFADKVKDLVAHHGVAFFEAGQNGAPGTIYILDMPAFDVNAPKGRSTAKMEIRQRLSGLVHEWEHWRHNSGNYQGIESGGTPISLRRDIPFELRLLAEMMAMTAEEPLRIRLFTRDRWEFAARLAMSPFEFMRSIAERSMRGP